jgi:tetratricopeptide (TPR) repeat protein
MKAAEMNDMDVFALHYLGDLHMQRGNLDKASRYYEKAMKISPRNLESGMNLGRILLEKNMTGKAVKVFSKILDLAEDPLAMREDIAAICMERKEYEYAVELYGFILRQTPGRMDIMSALVDAHVRSGEPKKAMAYLVEIEKKEEKDVMLLLKVARVYLSINQPVRADLVLQKVQRSTRRTARPGAP